MPSMQAIPILSQPMASLGLHSGLDGSDRLASFQLSPYPAILSLPRTQTIKDDNADTPIRQGSRQSYVPLVLNNDKVNQKDAGDVAWVGGAISTTGLAYASIGSGANPQRREALRVGFDLTGSTEPQPKTNERNNTAGLNQLGNRHHFNQD